MHARDRQTPMIPPDLAAIGLVMLLAWRAPKAFERLCIVAAVAALAWLTILAFVFIPVIGWALVCVYCLVATSRFEHWIEKRRRRR